MLVEHGMSDTDRIFLEALERFEKPLIRYARSYTRELEDARDVVQDVFLKLSQHLHQLDTTNLAPWLFTTCKNRALDLHRKNRRLVTMENETLDLEPTTQAGPGAGLEAQETSALLHRLIKELPAKQQQAVWMKFVIDLSYQEISQVMQTSVGNVGYLIHHGVAAMRMKWRALEPV